MITIKDYARGKGVSYEAIRKQINRYKKKELAGHIITKNRTQYIDDDGIVFLDQKRKENPVVIVQAEKSEEIERLKEENRNLLIKIGELQDRLIKSQDRIDQLQQEKIELLQAGSEAPAPDHQEEKKGFFWSLFHRKSGEE